MEKEQTKPKTEEKVETPKQETKEAPKKAEKKEAPKEKIKKLSKEELNKVRMEKIGELYVYEIIEYPLVTEKAINMIENENKMNFIVNRKATKPAVKRAVEALYQVKVDKVNMIKDMKNRKKAVVQINKAYKADDIATQLGVL